MADELLHCERLLAPHSRTFARVEDLPKAGQSIYLVAMRLIVLAALMLLGCDNAWEKKENRTAGYVVSANGDAENYTSSGYPRHRYCACGRYIALSDPFEVVENGWGQTYIAIPVAYLKDRETTERAQSGGDWYRRVGFNFPSRYREEGMREWLAKGGLGGSVRPLAEAAAFMRSPSSRQKALGPFDFDFQGTVSGLPVAMECSASDMPNPFCDAEVDLPTRGLRFMVTLPPSALSQLGEAVEIGRTMFGRAASSCAYAHECRTGPEIQHFRTPTDAKKF